MTVLASHEVKIGSRTYFIKLPNRYDNGGTSNIGSVLGIKRLSEDTEISADTDTLEVSAGLRLGKLMRIRISYEDPANANQKKSAQILCPVEKAAGAITALLSKKYNGGEITSAGIPRRRRLG